jgi:phosphoketolase
MEATRVLGTFLRDVMKLNLGKQNFRLFGPDETASNRLEAVYEVSGKVAREPRNGSGRRLSHELATD